MSFKLFICRYLLFASFFALALPAYSQNSRAESNEKLNLALNLVEEKPKLAVELGMKSFSIAREARDFWAMAMAKAGVGYISYQVGDYKAAFLNYVDALELLDNSDTTDLSNQIIILNELSMIQSDFNNHDESIKYGERAWALAKEYVKNYPEHAEEYDQLGWLVEIPYYLSIEYQAKGAHTTAGRLLVDLWEDAEDKNDILAYSQVLNELGIIKMNNGEHGDAQEYFGLVVSGRGVVDSDKSIAYQNLAETYMKQGNYQKANSYFLIALDLKKKLDDPYSQFIAYLGLGELEHKNGNIEKAIEYWETGIDTYDDISDDPELYSVYNWLQLAYMDIDIEKAKDFNQVYSQLNNFYVKNQTEQRGLEAQNRQELINYIDQERQSRVDAAQRKQFIKQFWPVLLGVALLLIFSMILGVRYYKAIRINKALAQAQLSTQESSTDIN